ncbi:MAG: vanadium-dependent haloperoxidase [Planctomycetota bacterium]|jgi:hypothetical protein
MSSSRKQQALDVRIAAAELAASRPHPNHVANGDEQKFRRETDGKSDPSYVASFTKGLQHCFHTGLIVSPGDFQQFVKGIDSGDPRDFIDTPLGPGADAKKWQSTETNQLLDSDTKRVRAWESQGAGRTFDLEGPDAQAVTMPPAPPLGSAELTAEIAEVYAQALLRDVPFTEITEGRGKVKFTGKGKPETTVQQVLEILNSLDWFSEADIPGLTAAEAGRRRGQFDGQNAFRGVTPGDNVGPYLSQFLLAGNAGINGNDVERCPSDGLISYGAVSIDQRVRFATPHQDYMQLWKDWLDVQNAAALGGTEVYEADPKRRFITTPRDLATYVHYDALYEAYLNACLILLANGIPFDPGIPFQRPDTDDHQQGFAHFGGPHILSLVTEVATRALKAVRFQKFNVHRRLRPEALAGRISRAKELCVPELSSMVTDLQPMLDLVAQKNPSDADLPDGNYLLPMAFREGSPMHPAYGAGHATVAGACITILKAFFDHKHPLAIAAKGDATKAFVSKYVASKKESSLEVVDVCGPCGQSAELTVEGELNKLASNISIGRDWAGVHYFTDYIESLRMGEQIAIGILEEQKLTYGENFSMTVPLYDGGSVRI